MSHEQGKETVTQSTKGASETVLATPSPHDMSRSPTVHSEGTVGETKGDVQQVLAKDDDELPSESTLGVVEKKLEAEGKSPHVPHHNASASLPSSRKSISLFCFCLSMFIDAAGVSATFLMTVPISEDLNVKVGDQAWISGTYSMAFAATSLFAGRLADLYPPHRVYLVGFAGIAVFYLIISFMTDQYSFFILRAFSALLAVLTIPSSLNMIIQMYPHPEEQAKKLALFGMAAALANTLALIISGVFLLASWRWYFRATTIVVAPFTALAWYVSPKTEAVAQSLPGWEKIKRMDIGGVLILLASLVLFILAFTQAPADGWKSAIFIAPLIIGVFLFVLFIFWERRMPRGYSLLPHDIWSYPNIFPLIIQTTAPFLWFACSQLRIASYFEDGLGNSPISAAAKILPMGITALFVGVLTQVFPWLVTRPRYVQPIASALCFTGSMLFAYSGGGHGKDYWRYMFTGQVIGTVGGMLAFLGMQTNVIQSFPLEFAGIGGSFAMIIFQIGGVIGIAVQAGSIATGDGTLTDWTGSKNGYFFTGAYVMVTGIIFFSWYRQEKMPVREAPPAGAV